MGSVAEYSSSDSFLVRLGRRWQWLICFAASTAVVFLGVDFGRQYVLPGPWLKAPETFLESLGNWDGNIFYTIVQSGYSYVPGQPASVYFFPLYPLTGWCVTKLTGWSPRLALVVVSHLCFAASLYLLGRYMRRRYGPEQEGAQRRLVDVELCSRRHVLSPLLYGIAFPIPLYHPALPDRVPCPSAARRAHRQPGGRHAGGGCWADGPAAAVPG